MKNTNFQLDDFVFVNGKPMQVKAVHKGKLGFHYEPCRLTWYRIGLLEPIPLYDEILDKNFEKVVGGDWQLGLCWRIGRNPNYGYILSTLEIDEFGGGYYQHCVPCTYLHELQHLLSDLRIKKKIEL